MFLGEAAAVGAIEAIGRDDPALARQVAALPWLADEEGITGDGLAVLVRLQELAATDAALAQALAETPWLADGVVEPSERATLAIIGGIAGEDPALARQVAGAPEVSDGMSQAELSALTGSDNYFLELLERDHPDIAKIIRDYPWASGGPGSRRHEGGSGGGLLARPLPQPLDDYDAESWNVSALSVLRGLSRDNQPLAERVAALPWAADGFNYFEYKVLEAIYLASYMAGRKGTVAMAEDLASLPWVADDITKEESEVLEIFLAHEILALYGLGQRKLGKTAVGSTLVPGRAFRRGMGPAANAALSLQL